ncbi:MAG: NADH-quinone oxidoreductase subunit NuoE [Desulfobacterales bacterium]|nr:NADH-quinone oxidoreductase subunit NuoE [Desulfobacterales bacterium]
MMTPEEIDPDRIQSILRKHHHEKWGLIPVLQEIQENFGYIPPQTIEPVANALRIYPSQVQGVVTFYAGLSTEPKGRYVIRVCRGTACHVKGGRSVLQFVKRELGLNEGETTPDYLFTLETVACLGACFLAPTMMINKTYYGRLTPAKIASILNQYGKREKE